ncbi:hypothetical protein [Streptomyces sp. NPDC056165]|uniref:hypothetical protein n=1 Tax=Streptomyces sp. NPDC056165 TaxID=3345733 RepID=UPI0035DB8E9D
MEVIDAYIDATRGVDATGRVNRQLNANYRYAFASMVDSLRGLAGRSDLGRVALKVTWSNNVKAETVRIGDVAYIVYDQFVGQTFRRLTRFTVTEHEVAHLDAYLFKLYANLFLVNGHPRTALEFGLRHHGMKGKHALPPPRMEEQEAWHGLQEHFVLAHELAHWFLRSGTLEAMQARTNFLTSLRAAGSYSEHRRTGSWRMRSLDESVRTWRVSVQRAFGLPPSDSAEQRYRDTYATQTFNYPKNEMEQILQLFSEGNEELIEECVCDGVATNLVGEFAEKVGMTYLDGMRASFAALKNMRFLRQVDAKAKARVNNLPVSAGELTWNSPDVLRWITYRSSLFAIALRRMHGIEHWTHRDAFSLLDYVANSRVLEKFHAPLVSYSVDFYERLHDHAFDIFTKFIAVSAIEELRQDPGYRKINDMTLTQCIIMTKACCSWV